MRNQIQIKNDSILLDARLSFYRYKARGSDEFIVSFFFYPKPAQRYNEKPVLLLLFKKTIFILIYIILI